MKAVSKNLTVYNELYARLIRIFENELPVFFSFSGGKDSLVIAKALEELIQQKKIEPKRLHVLFIDEEAIYPCVERIVHNWRKRFMMLGAQFHWLCMEFKHFNCFNSLENDESYICWDSTKRDVWIREMPSFAITEHPLFKFGMTYQDFLSKLSNCIQIVGVRATESVQRLSNFENSGGYVIKGTCYYYFPIYDWTTNDVFLFIKNKGVELPDAYQYMWKSGVSLNRLRISQFFSIDTVSSLVRMVEYYPGLYQKILAREPNAYLVMHYYDTEMFRRSTSRRRKLEGEDKTDYKAQFYELYSKEEYKAKPEHRKLSRFLSKYSMMITDKFYKKMHEILIAGDPKQRSIRALYSDIGSDFYKEQRVK